MGKKRAHTPGPWEYRIGGNFVDVGRRGYVEETRKATYLGRAQGVIANMTMRFGDKAHDSIIVANARLIAAAPEMLEALKAFLDSRGTVEAEPEHCPSCKATHLAKSAIAKATKGKGVPDE